MMPKRPLFLAVACKERLLNFDQAWEILRAQRQLGYSRRTHMPVGEVAQELRYLRSAQVTQLLDKQKEFEGLGVRCRDPVRKSRYSRHGGPPISTSVGIVMGFLILLPIVITFLLSPRDWAPTAIAASISSALVVSLKFVFPTIVNRTIMWNRVIRLIVLLIAPTTFIYALYAVSELWAIANGNMPDAQIASLLRRLSSSLIVFGFCSATFLAVALWRHVELWAHEARVTTLRFGISRAMDGVPGSNGRVNELLNTVVDLLCANPYVRVVKSVTFWTGAPACVSVWYLEPDADSSNSFKVKAYATSPLPEDDVKVAFQRVADMHRPRHLDQATFDRVHEKYKSEFGKQWRKQFLRHAGRSDFVSLTGYVYARGIPVSTGDSDSCLAFDRSYGDVLSPEHRVRRVTRWLDFRSFAAYPVYEDRQEDRPVGVLIAFRTIRNAISPEEVDFLFAISRLIGSFVGSSTKTAKEVTDA